MDTDKVRQSSTSSTGSRRGVLLLIGGLILAGLLAGYSWLRDLPKD